MPTNTIASFYQVGGLNFRGVLQRTQEEQIGYEITLNPGVAGALSAAADGGVDGLPTGHGFEVNDIVDLHWADPTDGTHKVGIRIKIDVANTNDVEFAATSPTPHGDAFPAEDTPVVLSYQQQHTALFASSNLAILAAKCSVKSLVEFWAVSSAVLAHKFAGGDAWSWASDQGFANPLGSNSLYSIRLSNGSEEAGTFNLGMLLNSALAAQV